MTIDKKYKAREGSFSERYKKHYEIQCLLENNDLLDLTKDQLIEIIEAKIERIITLEKLFNGCLDQYYQLENAYDSFVYKRESVYENLEKTMQILGKIAQNESVLIEYKKDKDNAHDNI